MATEAGSTVFRAIADFRKLRTEARGAADDLEAVGKAGKNAGKEASSGLKQGEDSLDSFGKKAEELGPRMERTGKKMTLGLTLPIVSFGALAIKTFAEFDTSITKTGANLGVTGQEFEALRQKALDLGASTTFSATEVADAMLELSTAGVKATDVLGGATDAVVLLAQATGSDLSQSAAVVAQAMNAFNIPASEAAHISDVLTQAANTSAITMDGLAEALAHAGQLGATANQSLEDVVATISSLVNQGVPAAQAGTAVRQMMDNLKAPATLKAQKLIRDLGLELRNADGSMRPLPDLIEEITKKTSKMSPQVRDNTLNILFGVEAFKAYGLAANSKLSLDKNIAAEAEQLILVEKALGKEFVKNNTKLGVFKVEGADAIRTLSALNKESDGVAKAFGDRLSQALGPRMEAAFGSFQTTMIQFVTTIAPTLIKIVEGLEQFFNILTKIISIPGVGPIVASFLLLLAAIGPVLIVLAKVSAAAKALSIGSGILKLAGAFKTLGVVAVTAIRAIGVALISNPWILVILAVIAAIVLLIIHWDTVKRFVIGAAKAILDWLRTNWPLLLPILLGPLGVILALIIKNWETIKEVIGNGVEWVKEKIRLGWLAITTIFDVAMTILVGIVSRIWGAITGAVSTGINAVKSVIIGGINGVKAVWNAVWDGLKKTFGAVWDTIKSVAKGAVDFLKERIEDLKKAVKEIGKLVGEAVDKIPGGGLLKKGLNLIGLNQGGQVGKSGKVIHLFSRGGGVGGSGNSDTVPAMLTPGEFVVRKKAAQALGPKLLTSLNQGKLPGFARGGEVKPISGTRLLSSKETARVDLRSDLPIVPVALQLVDPKNRRQGEEKTEINQTFNEKANAVEIAARTAWTLDKRAS